MNIRDTLLIQAADLQDELNHVLDRLVGQGVSCTAVCEWRMSTSNNERVSLTLAFVTPQQAAK